MIMTNTDDTLKSYYVSQFPNVQTQTGRGREKLHDFQSLGDKDRATMGFVDSATTIQVRVGPKQYPLWEEKEWNWEGWSVPGGCNEALVLRTWNYGNVVVAFSFRATFCFPQLSFSIITLAASS